MDKKSAPKNAQKNALMDAVAEQVGKRAPAFKRKGMPEGKKPGLAVMIAIGGPKKPPMGKAEGKDEPMGESMPKAKKIAMLQEKIASLKAELALLEDEDEMDDEAMESDEAEDESEDED